MRISRIDEAFEKCREYWENASGVDQEIQSFLAQSMLVLIYAEFEKKLKEIVIGRCAEVEDSSVKEYIRNSTRIQSLKIGDIAGLVGRFGEIHKEEFRRILEEHRLEENLYESIRSNRNSVAHGGAINATLDEVKTYYEGGHAVLDYVETALWKT